MATIGKFYSPSTHWKYVVAVMNRGWQDSPHVYVLDEDELGEEVKVAIRLEEPKYYYTGSDKFTTEEIEDFIAFMQSPYTGKLQVGNAKIRTMWDYTILQWNLEFPEQQFELTEKDGYIVTIPMPDYMRMR